LTEESDLTYYTVGHVDLETDIVIRALASTLQRDGIADSLGDGFKALERCSLSQGYAGFVDGEIFMSTCNESGETEYGDAVDSIMEVTWVQLKTVL
jgi:hypothetical protein